MQFKRSMVAAILPLASMALIGAVTRASGQSDCTGTQWPFGGADIFNTRNAASETKISTTTVHNLGVKWAIPMAGDVSATPTVETNGDQTTVYVVDWGGNLYSIDGNSTEANGHINWQRALTDYTQNPTGTVARTSPAIVGDLLIIGDQGNVTGVGGSLPKTDFSSTTGASVIAVDKYTGKLVWRKIVSHHPYSVVTSSPVAFNGTLYVGVASLEENAGFLFAAGYPGFSFRGSVVALDVTTGNEKWRFHTISKALGDQGYTGGSVWGSTPVVDEKRNSLYVATGNNYSVPSTLKAGADVDPGDHLDSILALDLYTGALKWARRGGAVDANGVIQPIVQDTWDVASYLGSLEGGSYPRLGPDYDFGSGPNLFTVQIKNKPVDLIGAGEKSGIYWALNPDDGNVVWATPVGPGGTGGGIEWGSATDGVRVYCASANSDNTTVTIGGVTSTGGNWAALDAATGAVQWATLDPIVGEPGSPATTTTPAIPANPGNGHDYGMVTVANGVVFAGSAGVKPLLSTTVVNGIPVEAPIPGTGTAGGFFALDARTGKILWSYADSTIGSVNAGASVVNGVVYWGSGYSHLTWAFGFTGTPKLYAFDLK